jgi:hypothetical protein
MIRDLYYISFMFARKLDPKRGLDGAAEYARHMCTLWLFFLASLAIALVLPVFGLRFRTLLGPNRLSSDLVAVCALVLASIGMKIYLKLRKEFYSNDIIEAAFQSMPKKRRVVVAFIAIATPLCFLVVALI